MEFNSYIEKTLITNNNKEIVLKIYEEDDLTSDIIIYLETIEIPTTKYELKLELSSLQKNKIFLMCENNEQAIKLFESFLSNNNGITLFEEENYILLNIPTNNPLINEINFKINKLEKTPEEKINDLNIKINFLENEIKDLKKINNKKDEEIKNLNEKYNKLEKKLNDFISNIEYNNKKNKIISLSKIINNEKELNILKNFFSNPDKIEFIPIFLTSIHGRDLNNFFNICKNISPTIVLIYTNNEYKFGGFTPLTWDKAKNEKKFDNETFLFSINLNKKYLKFNDNCSISLYDGYGPRFGGGCDIGIKGNFENGWSNVDEDSTYLKDREITNNKREFIIKELEIYRVI